MLASHNYADALCNMFRLLTEQNNRYYISEITSFVPLSLIILMLMTCLTTIHQVYFIRNALYKEQLQDFK